MMYIGILGIATQYVLKDIHILYLAKIIFFSQ